MRPTRRNSAAAVAVLPCPHCHTRGALAWDDGASVPLRRVRCGRCGHAVSAGIAGDIPQASCPRCAALTGLARGKRDDGRVFFAFVCDSCGWVADDTFMTVAFTLLNATQGGDSDVDA